MDEPQNEIRETDNFFPLDEATITIFQEGTKQIEIINAEMSGALRLFLRQHKLDGRWRLAKNGRELERVPDVMPVQAGPQSAQS